MTLAGLDSEIQVARLQEISHINGIIVKFFIGVSSVYDHFDICGNLLTESLS
jgi:hypothetical protein